MKTVNLLNPLQQFIKLCRSCSLSMLKPLTVWIITNCGKLFKEMGIPDSFTCLLRKLYVGQQTIVRSLYGWNNWLIQNWEKSTARLFIVTLLISLIWRAHHAKSRLDELQAGIKITGTNVKNLRYADDTSLTAESEEELKSLLMRLKRREWKTQLKA